MRPKQMCLIPVAEFLPIFWLLFLCPALKRAQTHVNRLLKAFFWETVRDRILKSHLSDYYNASRQDRRMYPETELRLTSTYQQFHTQNFARKLYSSKPSSTTPRKLLIKIKFKPKNPNLSRCRNRQLKHSNNLNSATINNVFQYLQL